MKHLVISNRKGVENAEYFKNADELFMFLMINPVYDTLIFVFWGSKVPDWMLSTYRCIGFHTGPLLEGKGRGGSPIDNLKALGAKITTLCVFEMNSVIDGGRVILAMPLYVNCAKDLIIYRISQMLPQIVEYVTAKQPDIPETFKRLPNAK